MQEAKKIFARYYIVRGNQSLWVGNAADDGARFRQVCITSNEWASPFGVFQVYCLQGIGQGLKYGTLHVGPPELVFDADIDGLSRAEEKFSELVRQAQQEGYRVPSIIETLEFQAKAQQQKAQAASGN